MKTVILAALLLPLASAQYMSPIVPTNRNFFGGYPPPVSPFGGGGGFFGDQPMAQPPPFPPANSRPWPSAGMGAENFGGSDFAAYRQNAALLQRQQAPIAPYGSEGALSPITPFAGRTAGDPTASFMSQRRSPMPPIQVIYGKPLPMESQAEQLNQPANPPSSSSSSSLPLFLQGASEDVVEEYKRIIRKPKSTYEEQVKEIDQLVTRLDDDKQGLYRQFMNENDEREQKHRDRIHSNVAQMSESAQQQFAKISALLRNPALPNEERWARVLSLYGQMDGELREEFEKKFANFGVGI